MSFFSRLFGLGGNSLSAADFVAKRELGQPVIDVRTPLEFKSGHLKGARNIDVSSRRFEADIKKLKLSKADPIYLYCRSGARSSRAAGILRSMGHAGAINVGAYHGLTRAGAESA